MDRLDEMIGVLWIGSVVGNRNRERNRNESTER